MSEAEDRLVADFRRVLSDARKATQNAQALADDYRVQLDHERKRHAETQALNQAMREELARVQEVARRALGG
jgi:uncharacterized protein YktB (UPF0637 family)